MVELYQAPRKDRFEVPIAQCDVMDKKKLEAYRAHWRRWMAWYEHSPQEPHSIEQQIHTMLFNDLTYRSVVSARSSVPQETEISARTASLAYLLDTGYVTTQVLSVMRLLDPHRNVISVMRLLMDVRSNRETITRENYVSGTGFPYKPAPPQSEAEDPSAEEAELGLSRTERHDWIYSHDLHQTFDRLSGTSSQNRSRTDTIPDSVFKRLNAWLNTEPIRNLETLRNKFLAHAANAAERGEAKNQGVKFAQLDEAQRAIIRVERAITDLVLSRRIARDVVPMAPLGQFAKLNLVYATKEAEEEMYRRWDELTDERNHWRNGILDELVAPSNG